MFLMTPANEMAELFERKAELEAELAAKTAREAELSAESMLLTENTVKQDQFLY